MGSVVFVSSVSGFVSLKSMSVQGATKGNLHARCCIAACLTNAVMLMSLSNFEGLFSF